MTFKVGDKVRIIPQEQKFYGDMYNLTTFTGTIGKVLGAVAYVIFGSKTLSAAVLSKDLEPVKVKGQQLEFTFMKSEI